MSMSTELIGIIVWVGVLGVVGTASLVGCVWAVRKSDKDDGIIVAAVVFGIMVLVVGVGLLDSGTQIHKRIFGLDEPAVVVESPQ